MSLKSINEGFKRKLASLKSLNESVTTDLEKALFATLKRLQSNGETNIKAYEVAFQDTIEKQFPGKLPIAKSSGHSLMEETQNRP